LRLSDEDRANVSVAVAPPLSLSHSELKVAYVGVIYYRVPAQVSLQAQNPSLSRTQTHVAGSDIDLLNLVFVIITLLFWSPSSRVNLLANEFESTLEAGKGEFLWRCPGKRDIDNARRIRRDRFSRNDEVFSQTFLRGGHENGYRFKNGFLQGIRDVELIMRFAGG
jgi:hypothetical protein